METGTAEPKTDRLDYSKAFRNGCERTSAFFWTVLISGARHLSPGADEPWRGAGICGGEPGGERRSGSDKRFVGRARLGADPLCDQDLCPIGAGETLSASIGRSGHAQAERHEPGCEGIPRCPGSRRRAYFGMSEHGGLISRKAVPRTPSKVGDRAYGGFDDPTRTCRPARTLGPRRRVHHGRECAGESFRCAEHRLRDPLKDRRARDEIWLQLQLSRPRKWQASTHSCMSPKCSQSRAHSSQTSAHSAQVCLWCGVFTNMNCADVRQISAHAIIGRKWSGST
jgi:hypothetical protein